MSLTSRPGGALPSLEQTTGDISQLEVSPFLRTPSRWLMPRKLLTLRCRAILASAAYPIVLEGRWSQKKVHLPFDFLFLFFKLSSPENPDGWTSCVTDDQTRRYEALWCMQSISLVEWPDIKLRRCLENTFFVYLHSMSVFVVSIWVRNQYFDFTKFHLLIQ